MDNIDLVSLIQNILIAAFPLLLAITMHEAAQCFAAYKLGDKTPFMLGRVSINPSSHIELFGTIILPLISYIASNGLIFFGYAKPAPIDRRNFKNNRKSYVLTILSGLLANLFMALLWAIIFAIISKFSFIHEFFLKMAKIGVLINLSLFALNLLPIMPFDGGKILKTILPYKYSSYLSMLEPYAFIIIMLLSILGLFKYWLMPIITICNLVISFIAFNITSFI
jgi:Zn-dependent protease